MSAGLLWGAIFHLMGLGGGGHILPSDLDRGGCTDRDTASGVALLPQVSAWTSGFRSLSPGAGGLPLLSPSHRPGEQGSIIAEHSV